MLITWDVNHRRNCGLGLGLANVSPFFTVGRYITTRSHRHLKCNKAREGVFRLV